MGKTTLNNGDSGSNVRAALNSMFTELYPQNITHANILAAINGSTLVPGSKYIITDHATKHLIPYTNTIHTDTVEPLIVEAATTNKVFRIVTSTLHPEDYIEYDVTNILCEDNSTARKGKITHRIDKNGNETGYDFKGVIFLRKAIIVPAWSNSTSYAQSSLVSIGSKLYKYCWLDPSVAGESPVNHQDWIEYLDLSTFNYWLPYVLNSGTATLNIGCVLNAGVTYDSDKYFYTFSNSSGDENSAKYRNCKLADIKDYNNVVFTDDTDGQTHNINLKGNVKDVTFAPNQQDITVNTYLNGSIIKGHCDRFTFGFGELCIFGTLLDFTIDGVCHGNIVNAASLGHIMSEFPCSNIKSIADCTIGSDFWGNIIGAFTYCTTTQTFKDSRVGNIQYCNFGNSVEQCTIPTGCSYITTLLGVYGVIFPANTLNLIIKAQLSGQNLTPYATILAADYTKEIIQGSDEQFYLSYFDGSNIVYINIDTGVIING